ncbi:MAG: TonB family protein [Bacteroidota bacterium]
MNKAESNGRHPGQKRRITEHLSPDLIRWYVAGELSAIQMHAVERHCLGCPLCSESLESFSVLRMPTRPVNNRPVSDFLGADLLDLNARLDNRMNREKRRLMPLLFQPYSIAATFLLLLLGSVVFFTSKVNKKQNFAEEALLEISSHHDTLVIYQKPAFTLMRNVTVSASQKPAPVDNLAYSAPKTELATRQEFREKAKNKITSDKIITTSPELAASHPLAGGVPDMPAKKDVSSTLAKDEVDSQSKEAIASNSAASLPAKTASAETIPVKGTILSTEDGSLLPGVYISVKGTNKTAISDRDGYFMLEAPVGSTLVFNFVGFETKEVTVTNQPALQIPMNADLKTLSEVVVVGYGKHKEAGKPLPKPEGGYKELDNYLNQNLQYPEQAEQMQVKGTVGLEFTVERDGSLTGFKVLKSLGYGCDEEAVRAIIAGPKWKPAVENNQPVRKKVTTKIKFGK